MSAANSARVGITALGVACAISVWSIAHGSGAFTTYAGRSELAATLFIAAGLGLIAAGLITGLRRRLVGALAVVAGLVWFAPAWEGWEGGPALPRATAMLAAPLVLPVLGAPRPRRRDADVVTQRFGRHRRDVRSSRACQRCCWRWCAIRTSILIASPIAAHVSSSSVLTHSSPAH